MKLTTIIVYLFPVVVTTHNHGTFLESLLKFKANLYAKVNHDVQNLVNNLFELLNLTPQFLAKPRIKSMLTMHTNLNSMTVKNFEAYDKVIDAARPDTGNESRKGILLYELIEDALDAKPFNQFVKLKKDKNLRHHTKYKETIERHTESIPTDIESSLQNITDDDPVFSNSEEFMAFIKDFMKKVNDLNETDFTKKTPLAPFIKEDLNKPDLEEWRKYVRWQFSEPEPTDFNSSSSRRIYMGSRARIKQYPFVVSIHVMGVFVCAGSILSSDVIITAASCLQLLHNNRFYRENPKVVHVKVGSEYLFRGGDMIPVMECYFYPTYNPRTLANNLVLLRLFRHIKFYREGWMRKIRYDDFPSALPMNINGVVVIGWGSRKRSNIIDEFNSMMAVKLDVYPMEDCAAIYNNDQMQYVTKKHFCAGYFSLGAGACNKDLGSPGVVGGRLVGVVSFGSPICGTIDHPTVFTKIGYYVNWIESVLQDDTPTVYASTTERPRSTAMHYIIDLANQTPKKRRRVTPSIKGDNLLH